MTESLLTRFERHRFPAEIIAHAECEVCEGHASIVETRKG